MYYIYILFCSDETYYVGLTENIKKRIIQHKNSLVDYTKYRLLIKVIWIGIFKNKKIAANFEKYLKTGSGNAFFKKRLV
ncbi:MAG: GIY-YIG nuclease family protein [Patescibacteria group bacterium]|jgi:putative endonuclease